MIEKLLKEENCRILEGVKDWKDAVYVSLEPLIRQGYCTEEYVQAVYDATAEFGPYYVVTDNMALIHASNKVGVNQTQMAVTVLKNPIQFSEDGPEVRILIALAAVDGSSHVDGMAATMELFGDDDKSEDILAAPDGKAIHDLFLRYGGNPE